MIAGTSVKLLQPLRLREFRILFSAFVVSKIGDGIYVVALAWQVLAISNSPKALALVGLCWSASQVLLLPVTGVVADRVDRRHLMIVGDVLSMAAISGMGLLSLTGGLTIPMVAALAAVYGAGQALFRPSSMALVPMVVPADLQMEANALDQFVRPVSLGVVGPILGGVLLAVASPGVAFLVDSATFAFSALMVSRLQKRGAADKEPRVSTRRDLGELLRYVRSQRWLLVGFIASLLSMLAVWGPWETLVPYLVRNELGGSAFDLALVFGAAGLGSVVAAVTMGRRGELPKRAITVLYLAWAFSMFSIAVFGGVSSLWQAMLVAAFAQGSFAVLLILYFTIMYRLVPDRLLGRVLSLDELMSLGGLPLSFALIGPAAALLGARLTMVVGGVAGGVITLLLLFMPGTRDPERDGRLAEPANPGDSQAMTDDSDRDSLAEALDGATPEERS